MIRARLRQPRGFVDRDGGTGNEPSLLVRTHIDGEGEQVTPNIAIVQQRRRLGRRRVAAHFLAPSLRSSEKRHQGPLRLLNLEWEGSISLERTHSGVDLTTVHF